MRRTILNLFSITFLVLYVFTSLLMADECEAIRYHFNGNVLQDIKALGSIHLGRNIVLADAFLYYDYSDCPIIYVASFNDEHSGQSIGSLYLTLKNLVPIEIIRGEPLHMFAYENLHHWLPALAGEFKQLELIRVYYHPAMHPILKVRLLLMDGTEKIVVVDPEHEQIIAQHTLDALAINYQLPESINRLKNPAIFGSDAIKTFDSDEWYVKQLDVYEVNTTGDWNGCNPAALTNILGYWNDLAGFDFNCRFFHDKSALAYKSEVNLLLIDLAYNMGTDDEGFTWYPYYTKSGFLKTVEDKGYVCNVEAYYLFFNYFTIIDELDYDRPCFLGGSMASNSIYYRHSVCVIGYKHIGFPGNYLDAIAYLIVHDGRSTTPNQPREQLWYLHTPNGIFNPFNFMTVDFIECKSPSSSSSTTTTIEAPTSSSSSTTSTPATTSLSGDLTIEECYSMDEIELYAGAPEYYGPDCYAKLYVNNKSDQYINIISCQYDTHDSNINGCWCTTFWPGVDNYLIDAGWISATMSDGSKRTRNTTIVSATYSIEGCAWICNDLADRVLDVPIPTTNVESMNPCK